MNIIDKKKRQMGQGGFTLIELLVVIAILAVLAGLAVIGIGAMRKNARVQACKADLDTAQTALEAYNVATNTYPATLADINASTTAGQLMKRTSTYQTFLQNGYSSTTGQIADTACDTVT